MNAQIDRGVAVINGFFARWHGVLYAVSAFFLGIFLSWRILSLATPLGGIEIAFLVACLAGLAIGLWMRGGEMRFLSVLATIAVYAGGFALAVAIWRTLQDDPQAIEEWQVWLIFTAIFICCYYVAMTWFRPSRRLDAMTPEEREEYLAVRREETRRKAELRSLPSQGWYQIASFVTGAAMIGSFATTAIGFYHEIVDPLDPPLVQYGIPVGLSALAALIIWAGWNFVFLRIRLASNMVSRLFGFTVGLIVLVPLTLAIHTVFGIIGVGGAEGVRAHNLWYADVLDAYERRVDGERAIEANRLAGALQYMSNQLQAAALNEERTGQGCGAGKGSLWTFYTDSASRTQTIVDIVTTRKNANQDIKAKIEDLRARIRRPEAKIEVIQPELAAQADQIRKQIMETDNSSAIPSVRTFITETRATVNSDAFFSGWSACTLAKKDVILAQINTLIDSVEESMRSAENEIRAKKNSSEFRIPPENRIETIPFIDRYFHGDRGQAIQTPEQAAGDVPVFVPMRPFWSVVSYAGSLMGYIALQLALDFSPAVLGLLFALLAPFPRARTRLGRLWENYWTKKMERWAPLEDEPAPAAPRKPVAPEPVAKTDAVETETEAAPETPAPAPSPSSQPAPEPEPAPASAQRREPSFDTEEPPAADTIEGRERPDDIRP
ncbi:hypothetical protein M2360_000178 [Rhizobium sp. SG_E_25_P2]|uniref:hypothetical protein n=1 Tax=Rhizobium sp. SG_E_25_P2 TaxID=2879942 RepID=UPI0024757EDE|nr:hypothetical protein [Rhizobium sp. SG_E_25_P2]MDH6264797.1 hypothetical protein [Rhizobium sp. SG_E_25_P2]